MLVCASWHQFGLFLVYWVIPFISCVTTVNVWFQRVLFMSLFACGPIISNKQSVNHQACLSSLLLCLASQGFSHLTCGRYAYFICLFLCSVCRFCIVFWRCIQIAFLNANSLVRRPYCISRLATYDITTIFTFHLAFVLAYVRQSYSIYGEFCRETQQLNHKLSHF